MFNMKQIIRFLTRCFDDNINTPEIECSEVDVSEGCAAIQGDRQQSAGQTLFRVWAKPYELLYQHGTWH